jgi:UDP:flavonoid glycosyltransferase YjiC (YdhE family)
MRILFCSLGSPGFLFPAIGLAAELRSRGHEVAFATAKDAAPYLDHAELRRIPCGDRDASSFQTPHWFHSLAVALQIRHIDHALARFAPDLMIGQPLTLGPSIVQERTGLPSVVQGLATHLWPGGGPRQPASALSEERCLWRHHDMMRHLNEARSLAGLRALHCSPEASPLLGDLLLLRTIPALHGGPGEPGRVHLVGACLWEPAARDNALESWLDDTRRRGAPLVYVQHGRSFGGPGFWRPLVDAFAGGPLVFAASTGRMDCEVGETSPGRCFLRPHLNQSEVLPHAQLMIGSASSAAVLGALTHGLPCLLIPAGGEQLDLAEQVQRAGAARILAAETLTADSLQEAVLDALGDTDLRLRALSLGRALASQGGFALSAQLLEQCHGSYRAPLPALGNLVTLESA